MRLAALLAATALAACASPTGLDAAGRFDSFEAQGTPDFSAYEAVYIAPVTFSDELRARIGYRPRGPQDRTRPLSESDLEGRAEDLAEAMTDEFAKVARLVDAPGPGVLTVEAVLTALEANRPTMAELQATPSLDFNSISVGDAGAQVTLRDGDRVIAVIEDNAFRRNLNDPTVGVGIWTTSRTYYDRLADKLASLLA